MTEGDEKTEVRERHSSKLLPVEFVDRAPVDKGPDGLSKWLGENLRAMVIENSRNALLKKYKVDYDGMAPAAKAAIDQISRDQGHANASILETYATLSSNIFNWEHVHNDQKVADELRQKRKGVQEALFAQALMSEQIVIDDLFERAGALQGQGSKVIEGKFLPQKK